MEVFYIAQIIFYSLVSIWLVLITTLLILDIALGVNKTGWIDKALRVLTFQW